jgi:hypothetical protein
MPRSNEITVKVNVEFDQETEEKLRQIIRDEIKSMFSDIEIITPLSKLEQTINIDALHDIKKYLTGR